MNTDRYRKLLKAKFGKPIRCADYLGKSTPIVHECRMCGYDYRAAPERVISGALCLWCTREAGDKLAVKVTAGSKFAARLEAKYEHISCENFGAANRDAKFSCWCGATWQAKPRSVLGSKGNPCPTCSSVLRFGPAGKLAVAQQTGRNWLSEDKKTSKLKCWCGTILDVPSRLVGSPSVGCPTCLGLTGNAKQIVYKFKALERVSYHVGGRLSLSNIGIEWPEIRAAAQSVARQDVPRITLGGMELPAGAHKWKSAEVQAWRQQVGLNRVVVLSLDPGVTNFAWSVLECTRKGRPELLATGMIQNTVKEFTGDDLRAEAALFESEIRQLVEEFSVTHLIAERFMSRGMKGLTIELVNSMLGILLNGWSGGPGSFKLITAAQWKNEWNRNSSLTDFYARCACEVHQVDSIGIGMYGIDHWFNRKHFEHLKLIEKTLVKQIKERNLG